MPAAEWSEGAVTDINRQLILAERPTGRVEDRHFTMREVPVEAPAPGQVLVRNLWLGFDPTQRGWLNPNPGYVPPVQVGEVMRAFAVGQVVQSDVAAFPAGSFVQGMFGWQDWTVMDPSGLTLVPEGVDPKAMLGVFGTTGLTAYFGMLHIGEPAAGETVVVSGAAGATGSVAAQLARIRGSRVIGIAGGAEKCTWLTEKARLDEAIDYRAEDVSSRLRELARNKISVYFDNVGGPTLDAALANIARGARVVLCGAISTGYTPEQPPPGPANYFNLVLRSARMQGFLLFDYASQFDDAIRDLRAWVDAGDLVYEEDVQEGLEHAPATLQRLFDGRNIGKQLLKITDPPLT